MSFLVYKRKFTLNELVVSIVTCLLVFIVFTGSFASVQAQNNSKIFLSRHGSGPGQLDDPAGIVVDPKGYLLVVDSDNDRVQKFTSNGTFVAQWGVSGSGPGQFNIPIGIDEDESKQNVYVTDLGNDRVMRFTNNGLFVSQWGSLGSGPGQFNNPGRIAGDPSGNFFVADIGNNRIEKFDANGKLIMMWGSLGADPGKFNSPTGMTVQYPSGNVYVADSGNSRIQVFTNEGKFIKKINLDQNIDATDNIDLDVNSKGTIYVTDRNADNIVVITP